jgi:hypothetical protein
MKTDVRLALFTQHLQDTREARLLLEVFDSSPECRPTHWGYNDRVNISLADLDLVTWTAGRRAGFLPYLFRTSSPRSVGNHERIRPAPARARTAGRAR